jgi:hypothetical protein
MKPFEDHTSPRPPEAPPILHRPIPAKFGISAPNASAPAWSPQGRDTHYINQQVAIPAEPESYPPVNSVRYNQHNNSSPSLVNAGRMRASPVPAGVRSRPTSPYAFVPIDGRPSRFSPYNFQKSGNVSPSMMSILTEDTTDSASDTLGSRASTTGVTSPPFYAGYRTATSSPLYLIANHPTQQEQPPRPKTPTGKKSPFKSSSGDDDSIRKSRIKTEMCMHYSSGRPCPFGSLCTYAHGEEELQLTRLMDLHKAGLVDKDTYRIKPCLTWVATGSWCVFRFVGRET